MIISFFIPGIPATAGSKRAYAYKSKKDGKFHAAVGPDSEKQIPWMSDVKYYAQRAMDGTPPLVGFVEVEFLFVFPRSKSHYGSGRNSDVLKARAPEKPVASDLTKLVRAAEDALKGVCWIDDKQVFRQINEKAYGEVPGAFIKINTEKAG